MLDICEKAKIEFPDWIQIVNEIGVCSKLREASNVLIKPNFAAGTYVEPTRHVVSSITLLSDFVRFILQYNSTCDVYIAESDSMGYGYAYLKFEHLGLPDSLRLSEIEKTRVHLLDLSRDCLVRVDSDSFKYFNSSEKQLWLSKVLLNADIVVSMSNLKTHAITSFTGACKNLFGCLPTSEKFIYHPWIHQIVHDLVLVIKPTINIVDAFYGMEKNGPVQGVDIDSGFRVFSDSAFEADLCASTLVGLNWHKIRYLRYLDKTLPLQSARVLNIHNIARTYYQKPTTFLRVMNFLGLLIQKVGYRIELFGHKLHACDTPMTLIIMIMRPLLIKLFTIDTLNKWKGKFRND